MAIGQGDAKKGYLATSLSFSNCRSSTRIFGRKRVAVSPTPGSRSPHSPVRTLRKQRSVRFHMDDAVNLIESLPQDVLVIALGSILIPSSFYSFRPSNDPFQYKKTDCHSLSLQSTMIQFRIGFSCVCLLISVWSKFCRLKSCAR